MTVKPCCFEPVHLNLITTTRGKIRATNRYASLGEGQMANDSRAALSNSLASLEDYVDSILRTGHSDYCSPGTDAEEYELRRVVELSQLVRTSMSAARESGLQRTPPQLFLATVSSPMVISPPRGEQAHHDDSQQHQNQEASIPTAAALSVPTTNDALFGTSGVLIMETPVRHAKRWDAADGSRVVDRGEEEEASNQFRLSFNGKPQSPGHDDFGNERVRSPGVPAPASPVGEKTRTEGAEDRNDLSASMTRLRAELGESGHSASDDPVNEEAQERETTFARMIDNWEGGGSSAGRSSPSRASCGRSRRLEPGKARVQLEATPPMRLRDMVASIESSIARYEYRRPLSELGQTSISLESPSRPVSAKAAAVHSPLRRGRVQDHRGSPARRLPWEQPVAASPSKVVKSEVGVARRSPSSTHTAASPSPNRVVASRQSAGRSRSGVTKREYSIYGTPSKDSTRRRKPAALRDPVMVDTPQQGWDQAQPTGASPSVSPPNLQRSGSRTGSSPGSLPHAVVSTKPVTALGNRLAEEQRHWRPAAAE